MKLTKILLSLLFAFVVCSAFSAKKKEPKAVYAFGVGASFTDTVVCYTEIQMLDSVKLDKGGFLPQRDLYSYQLKNYLEGTKGLPNRTCMIYFSKHKDRLEKELVKVLDRYKKNKSINLKKLDATEFRFKKPQE
ncbi:hypothetical protein [uncultured Bacteroides sp.]|uniref:hypothetical protein n=1 Tax=uncultured Bacteroides sp. TaxID=162156 RepID=UPI002AAA6A3A|nr:hypothetical protein [uncultured Bacteroides sp.]